MERFCDAITFCANPVEVRGERGPVFCYLSLVKNLDGSAFAATKAPEVRDRPNSFARSKGRDYASVAGCLSVNLSGFRS